MVLSRNIIESGYVGNHGVMVKVGWKGGVAREHGMPEVFEGVSMGNG